MSSTCTSFRPCRNRIASPQVFHRPRAVNTTTPVTTVDDSNPGHRSTPRTTTSGCSKLGTTYHRPTFPITVGDSDRGTAHRRVHRDSLWRTYRLLCTECRSLTPFRPHIDWPLDHIQDVLVTVLNPTQTPAGTTSRPATEGNILHRATQRNTGNYPQ